MTMVMSSSAVKMEQLTVMFPFFPLSTIQDVLESVGDERVVDTLIEMGSDSTDASHHQVDVAESETIPSLFPREQAPSAADNAKRLMGGGSGGTESSSSWAGTAASGHARWQDDAAGQAQYTPSNGHSPVRSIAAAAKPQPVASLPKRPATPDLAPDASALSHHKSSSDSGGSSGASQRNWWPKWQAGKPAVQLNWQLAVSPPAVFAAPPAAMDTHEDLLAVLQSGSGDCGSDSGSTVSAATAASSRGRGKKASKKTGRRRGKAGGYSPSMMSPSGPKPYMPAACLPNEGSSLLAVTMHKKGIDTGQAVAKLAFDGPCCVAGSHHFDYASWGGGQLGGGSGRAVQRQAGAKVEQDKTVEVLDVAPVIHGDIRDFVVDDSPDAVSALSDVDSSSAVGMSLSSPEGLVPGLLGQTDWDEDDASLEGWLVAPVGAETASPGSPPQNRPGSAVDSLYSLKRPLGSSKSGSKAPSSIAGSLNGDTASLSGSAPDSDAALEFLLEAFQDQEPALLKDVLTSFNGDIEATVQQLNEMARDEEAHLVAASMAHNLQDEDQEGMTLEVKVALLQLQYPAFSREQVTCALEAQAGSVHGAATLLELQTADKAAVEAARKQEKEAEDFQVAQRLHQMQLADATAHPETMRPSPAASPEDLAAIAALEAADVVPYGETRCVAAEEVQPSYGMASVAALRGPAPAPPSRLCTVRLPPHYPVPPPPPPYPRPAPGISEYEARAAADDHMYKSLLTPASAMFAASDESYKEMAVLHRKGKHQEAHQKRKEAVELRAEARRVQAEAQDTMFRTKNMEGLNKGKSIPVDLHGMHVAEALQKLEPLLVLWHSGYIPMAVIITGKGRHSADGEAKIRPAVRAWLESHNCDFRELPGSYEVYFDNRFSGGGH